MKRLSIILVSLLTFYDACTYPSDLDKYPTIPEGFYEASVGSHKGSYTALKMYDIGKSIDDQTIVLGFTNPATGTDFAAGVNIHKAGNNNFTGMDGNKPVSAACALIDRNNWDEFINHFNNDGQYKNKVGIFISRSFVLWQYPEYHSNLKYVNYY